MMILITGTSVCLLINVLSGIIAFLSLTSLFTLSLIFTIKRYIRMEHLSRYLRRISNGEYKLDIRDNTEGELSVLKNEIYKVTVTLYEQAELMKKEKIFLSETLSDISHQIKTPLTSLSVMADLLSNQNLPADKRVEFTKNIRSQLERLQWLVSSLLKLSKMDAGAIEFKKDAVYVKNLIDKAVEHLLIPIEIKEQTLEIIGDSNISFKGDFQWTSEAIANIVKNCIEHTPVGGKIKILFDETPIYTFIEISDNGEGIDKEDLPHLFERFYKGKNARNESIGIGLAMSKSIIEKQSGIIDVSSKKDMGSVFTVKIYKYVV